MKGLLSLVLLFGSFFSLAQSDSYFIGKIGIGNVTYRTQFSSDPNTAWTQDYAVLNVGLGYNRKILPKILRFEFSTHISSDEARFMYYSDFPDYEEISTIETINSTYWQNRFLIAISNGKNTLNFKTGIIYDYVINQSSSKGTENSNRTADYLITSAGLEKYYSIFSLGFAFQVNIAERVGLELFLCSPLSPRFRTGKGVYFTSEEDVDRALFDFSVSYYFLKN